MGAGAEPAPRLGVSATVGVEVRVSDGVEDAKETTVSVNGFNVYAIGGFQGIDIVTPQRTSRVQTWKNRLYVGTRYSIRNS